MPNTNAMPIANADAVPGADANANACPMAYQNAQ